MPHADINDKREATRRWKRQNPLLHKAAKNRRQERSREYLYQYKLTHPCERCGEDHPGCIQFHHKDPGTKDGDLSGDCLDWGIARIEKEIAKCEVLCANCHTKYHWLERNSHRKESL